MDILWPAVGISVIVGFVFYVLAGHWGRLIRQQAGTIRHLSDRVQMIEEVDNPHFRARLGESVPAPLEQVFTFTFRFSDKFWRDTLRLSDSDWHYVRTFGTFVGSVKIERWRSHTVATITEVLPDRKTAAWQTRSLYDYPAANGEPLTLWELPLARPAFGHIQPSLELTLCGNAMELTARVPALIDAKGAHRDGEVVFFRAPLDSAQLTDLRSQDPAEPTNGNGASNGHTTGSWRAFYAWQDETRGIEWQLRLIDLNRKTDWDRWKILESAAPRVASGS